MDTNPTYIHLTKAEGNLSKFLYLLAPPKEKMRTEFSKVAVASHTNFALINCNFHLEKRKTPAEKLWHFNRAIQE